MENLLGMKICESRSNLRNQPHQLKVVEGAIGSYIIMEVLGIAQLHHNLCFPSAELQSTISMLATEVFAVCSNAHEMGADYVRVLDVLQDIELLLEILLIPANA